MKTCNKDQMISKIKQDKLKLMETMDNTSREFVAFEVYTKLSQVQKALEDERLNNEKVILALKDNDSVSDIVLCYWCERDEYVVWTREKGTENYFWGHYFQSLTSAFEMYLSK